MPATTIVVLDQDTNGIPLPRPSFEHEWVEHGLTRPDEVAARIREADIVISNKVPVGAKEIDGAPRLRMVAISATGHNHIDLVKCAERGITVSNVRGYANRGISEHVVAMLLCVLRNLHNFHASVVSGEWQESPIFWLDRHPVLDLDGLNLGIVGAGNLGRATGKLAAAMGMNVRYLLRGREDDLPRIGLDELLAWSNVVSLHCPLAADNAGMVDAGFLGKMRDGSVLINTARGGLVDHQALIEALRSGKLAGAALDVLDQEPPPHGHPIIGFRHPGLLITPHVAWVSRNSLAELARQVSANIEGFMAGTPTNVVEAPR